MGERTNFVAGEEGIEMTSTVVETVEGLLPRAPDPEFDKAAVDLMNEPTGIPKVPASEDQQVREEAMKEPSVLGEPDKRPSVMKEIMEKIKDPQAAKTDLANLIAYEMASLLNWIDQKGYNESGSKGKPLEAKNMLEQLKGVRELGKQLMEADNANQDYINFDGNKFKKVMDHWFETSKEALHEIGFDDNTIKNFIMHWADILGKTDIKLRREVQDIK